MKYAIVGVGQGVRHVVRLNCRARSGSYVLSSLQNMIYSRQNKLVDRSRRYYVHHCPHDPAICPSKALNNYQGLWGSSMAD